MGPLGWLVGAVIGSAFSGFIVVRVLEFIALETSSTVSNAAKSTAFIGTWAAVTTHSGMKGFNNVVERLQIKSAAAQKKLSTPPKGDRS